MTEELKIMSIERGLKNYDYVLDAMGTIPRHAFIPLGFEDIAYQMNPVLIDENQTMSNPYTVYMQTYILDPKPKDIVLEIGTGSGYQASVLSQLVSKVYTIERFKSLFEQSGKLFQKLKLDNVEGIFGDGFEGLPEKAPFDKIIITCGAPEVPQELLLQLKVGGKLLIPLDNEEGLQDMLLIHKTGEDTYEEHHHGHFLFVPMLKGKKNSSI